GITLSAGATGLLSTMLAPEAARAHNRPQTEGEVHRFSRGGVTFHTYISPDRGLRATAHIIEFKNEVLLIDATFFPETGAEVADLIKQIGKPVA
ncbi:hypothetical protein, partial [Epibacterium ulvae]|uniref:hypothetical protein n=1 Tax=Epibacterium ulvae TaxID=1156985 RepID=UPI002492C659